MIGRRFQRVACLDIVLRKTHCPRAKSYIFSLTNLTVTAILVKPFDPLAHLLKEQSRFIKTVKHVANLELWKVSEEVTRINLALVIDRQVHIPTPAERRRHILDRQPLEPAVNVMVKD